MIEIIPDIFFFLNLVTALLISISCLNIAYIWKKRKIVFINFLSLGITYSLVYIFLSFWYYTHVLFTFIVGNILLFTWVILFTLGTFTIIFPKKTPLDYLPLIYLLIPFILLYTGSIETTLRYSLNLSGIILILTFIKLILFGTKSVKIVGTSGILVALIQIIYVFSVFFKISTDLFIFLFNVFLAVPFLGFWYISKKKPDRFFKSHGRK